MLKFDSLDYWESTTWDRYLELNHVPEIIRQEFLIQERLTVSFIQDITKSFGPISILDLACGTGHVAEEILKAIPGLAKVTLVDINARTLEVASQHLGIRAEVDYVQANAYGVGARFVGRFDVVICLDFLHHVSDLDRLFEQICMAMRPTGIFIGNVFAKETYLDWDRLKYGRLKALRREVLHTAADKCYGRVPRYVKTLIRKHGFARLAPLSKHEFVDALKKHFKQYEIKEGYYYLAIAQR